MEKTKISEESYSGGVRGLGNVTGDPAIGDGSTTHAGNGGAGLYNSMTDATNFGVLSGGHYYVAGGGAGLRRGLVAGDHRGAMTHLLDCLYTIRNARVHGSFGTSEVKFSFLPNVIYKINISRDRETVTQESHKL